MEFVMVITIFQAMIMVISYKIGKHDGITSVKKALQIEGIDPNTFKPIAV